MALCVPQNYPPEVCGARCLYTSSLSSDTREGCSQGLLVSSHFWTAEGPEELSGHTLI